MLAQPSLVPPSRARVLRPSRRPLAHRVAARDEQPGAPATTREGGLGPTRSAPLLLVVDDDALMTTLLPRKLGSAFGTDLRILTATTPEQAAQLVRETRPDIILSDYDLRSDKNGIDVLADAARVLPDCVRILFSGHTRQEIGPNLDRAAIHGFIEKPFRLDEMFEPFARVVRAACGLELEPATDEGR